MQSLCVYSFLVVFCFLVFGWRLGLSHWYIFLVVVFVCFFSVVFVSPL